MGMARKACGWVTRPNGMVEADSIEWNAGGDSSDRGTLGCPPKADSSKADSSERNVIHYAKRRQVD